MISDNPSNTQGQCPACRSSFSARGLQNHLAQSVDGSRCKAVYYRQLAAAARAALLSADSESESEPASPLLNRMPVPQAPVDPDELFGPDDDLQPLEDHFMGLGDNDSDSVQGSDDEGFLPELDEQNPGDFDDEDAADVAAMEAELEHAWEPERNGAPVNRASVEEEDDTDSADSQSGEGEQPTVASTPRIRFKMSEGLGLKPAVVVRYSEKYPGSRAGQPSNQVDSTDAQYQSAVGGDNPWAPFASKVDWEVARWAKLRGQGSTAFSELLSIEGVRHIFNCCRIQMTHKSSRCPRFSDFPIKTLTS